MQAGHRASHSPAPAATVPFQWTPTPSPSLLADVSSSYPGRLVILKQNCLTEEKFVRNGQTCNVRIVVKNSPFIIHIGYEPFNPASPPIDFKSLTIDARLIYDTPEEKEVDFIKLKPLDTKININDAGTFVNCEARLKVLTSQLEDSFFKIRFRAYDARTKKDTGLMVLSHSIKTVSKPDKLRKKKKAEANTSLADVKPEPISAVFLNNPVAVLAAAAMSTASGTLSSSGILASPPSAAKPKRKRAPTVKVEKNVDSDEEEEAVVPQIDEGALFAALGGASLSQVMGRIEQNQNVSNQLLSRIATALGAPAFVAPSYQHSSSFHNLAGAGESEEGDDDSSSYLQSSQNSSVLLSNSNRLMMSSASSRAASEVLSTALPHGSSYPGALPPPANPSTPSGQQQHEQSDKEPDLDACFSMLLQSLENTSPGPDRAAKVRSVVRTLSITRNAASELHDLFWAEGLGRALGTEGDPRGNMMGGAPAEVSATGFGTDSHDLLRGGSCSCPDCPAKKELERVENFYREVFSMTS